MTTTDGVVENAGDGELKKRNTAAAQNAVAQWNQKVRGILSRYNSGVFKNNQSDKDNDDAR